MSHFAPATSQKALDGIEVLDLTSALAGPYCAQVLGDLGADVIKIEQPGKGDQSRGWGPFVAGESTYFIGTNRNKRSLTLDLSQEAGQKIFRQLLAQADIVLHNIPKQTSRKKLGLDEQSCREIKPNLIYATITGFGDSGPMAEKPGYDVIIQGMGGSMAVTGAAGSPPQRFPTPIADITTGLYTAISLLTALFFRERTGQGQTIDNSLLECQATWLANLASNHLLTGNKIPKLGNEHPSIVPYQPFPTADNWIIVGVGTEVLWQRFVDVLERPDLAKDPRFVCNADRLQNRQVLAEIVAECLSQKTSAQWLEKLDAARIPAGAIYPPETVLQHEQLLARGMIVEFEHSALGTIRNLGSPIHLSQTPVSYRFPPPTLGEHNQQILTQLEYSPEQIQLLQQDKVI